MSKDPDQESNLLELDFEVDEDGSESDMSANDSDDDGGEIGEVLEAERGDEEGENGREPQGYQHEPLPQARGVGGGDGAAEQGIAAEAAGPDARRLDPIRLRGW